MKSFCRDLDFGSLSVMFLTLILFTLALFTKGFTHDLLLEAGVFLVSVKLILAQVKITSANKSIESKIDRLIDNSQDKDK